MANENPIENLDGRVRQWDVFLAKEIEKLMKRPYAERANIEGCLKPYTIVRNALRTGYKAAWGQDLPNVLADDPLSLPTFEELNLSTKVRNNFQRAGITTVTDLLKISERDLSSYKNFGPHSIAEIKAKLAIYGLSLV